MNDRDFFYLQYNNVNWQNQDTTHLNEPINKKIISLLSPKKDSSFCMFDMGFGIGYFIDMVQKHISTQVASLHIEGCEPSKKSFDYAKNNKLVTPYSNTTLSLYNIPFQHVDTTTKFHLITSIYVFPHFVSDDIPNIVQRIHNMLLEGGRIMLAIAQEQSITEKLSVQKDLCIEKKIIEYNGKIYQEVLHYTNLPDIGKVVDYNREEKFYLDVFHSVGFTLESKTDHDDGGFYINIICI